MKRCKIIFQTKEYFGLILCQSCKSFLLSWLVSAECLGALKTFFINTFTSSTIPSLTPFWIVFEMCYELKVFIKKFLMYKMRYESSTLILYKELSSPIFQSLWVTPSVRHAWHLSRSPLCAMQYIKAWMSSTDPVSSITNRYRLIVSYTDPVHSFIIS